MFRLFTNDQGKVEMKSAVLNAVSSKIYSRTMMKFLLIVVDSNPFNAKLGQASLATLRRLLLK